MSESVMKISIDALKPHPRNQEFFDDITGEEYENLKSSIQNDGIRFPIMVSPDMTIISGHQRLRVAKELEMKIVPVMIEEDLVNEDEKLRVLLGTNFQRVKNDESKQRKIIAEYVKLCGYERGEIGKNHSQKCQNGTSEKLTLDEIAKQLGTSKRNLQRALSIERNLTDDMKELLDTGVISKTLAADLISFLTEEEQEELITKLDVTKKYTQKQVQKYIDEIRELKENPVVPDDYKKLKQSINHLQNECDSLRYDYTKKASENLELKKRLNQTIEDDPQKTAEKELVDSTSKFCSKINSFITQVGGYIWIADKINNIPDTNKNEYIRSVQLIKKWADTLLYNINNKMKEIE